MNFTVYQQSYDDYPTQGEYIDFAYWKSNTLAATFEVSTDKAPSAALLAGVVEGACKGTFAWFQAVSDHDKGSLHALLRRPRRACDSRLPRRLTVRIGSNSAGSRRLHFFTQPSASASDKPGMILTSQVESLLQPVAAPAPCGSDLEYDPAFLELERLVQGKPEQQMGSAVVPAQEPDWHAIARRAAALLSKTKDLRIALHLTRAWLNIDGFAGLRDGLAVLRGLAERYWDGVFPRLDPDDGNDPIFRVNILMGLCDSAAIIEPVRALPLVMSRSFGRFSLRDLAIASGELPPAPGAAPPASAAIDGAFSESALADLQATAVSVRESLDHLAALETTVGAQVGVARGPSLAKLSGLLGQAHRILAARLEQRGVKSASPASGSPGDAAAAALPLGAVRADRGGDLSGRRGSPSRSDLRVLPAARAVEPLAALACPMQAIGIGEFSGHRP